MKKYEIRPWSYEYGIYDPHIENFIGPPMDSYDEALIVCWWLNQRRQNIIVESITVEGPNSTDVIKDLAFLKEIDERLSRAQSGNEFYQLEYARKMVQDWSIEIKEKVST